MKKIIGLSLTLFGFYSAYSQDCCDKIVKLGVEIDSLNKLVIKPLKDSILILNTVSVSKLSKMQGQITKLEKDSADLIQTLKNFEKRIESLNKNNVKIERDDLQKQVGQLTTTVSALTQQNLQKDGQIADEKKNAEQKAKAEKENGKKEVMDNIVNSYLNKKFDNLISFSTKLSVQRDIQLIGNNAEVKTILSDLQKYFNGQELLEEKIDVVQIKNVQSQLSQVKQQSALLDKLKENLKYYKDFNDELKKTIEKLVELDTRKVTGGVPAIQKLKFNEIMSELSNYMYNYYDYAKYSYLSEIILEIIKRKKLNADADVLDLLRKLL